VGGVDKGPLGIQVELFDNGIAVGIQCEVAVAYS
jgi:hypothetical protein